jgi:tetratricopeptide (TPR) repeat protein
MSNGTSGAAPGIGTRSYKSGSIVYMEGDKSDNIYILKAGRVILTTRKVEDKVWVEVKENVKPGEFFGVKSAVGKYPRDETAQTFGETTVLVLSLADFERLILKNISVVKKMLRVFSNQLRKIGKTVREVLGETDTMNPDAELFKIGEYYYKAGRFNQAIHAFKKYIEYYPDAKYSGEAGKRINAIESGNTDVMPASDDITAQEKPEPARPRDEVSDLTDFSIDDDVPPDKSGSSSASDDFDDMKVDKAPRSPVSEMDDFLMDKKDDSTDSLDDFNIDEPAAGGNDMDNVNEIFYEAVRLFSEEKYSDALSTYEKVLNTKTLKNEAEKRIFEKAHYEVGRCYIKMGNYKEALTALSGMIKKFPKSELYKSALLYIGIVFETTKNVDNAIKYYNQVAAMEPKDQINKEALTRLNKLKSNQGKR